MFPCLLLSFTGMASTTAAETHYEICVRDSAAFGMDPCARGMLRHSYVTNKLAEETICTMVYDDSYCKSSPREFDHVKTPGGQIVCTVNYHQPPISAQCATNPEQYRWATAAYQPNP